MSKAVSEIFIIALLVMILLTYPIMWAWNYSIHPIFSLPEINFWQAFCLVFLSNVFFKSPPNQTNKTK